MSDDKKLHQMELDPFAGEYDSEPLFDETPASYESPRQPDHAPTIEPENSVEPTDAMPLFPDEAPEDFSKTDETTTDSPIYSTPPEQKSGINIGMVAAVILVAVAAIGYLTIADNGDKTVQTAQVEQAEPEAVEVAKVEAAKVEAAKVKVAKEMSTKTATPSATLPATDSGNWIIYLASVGSEKSAHQLVARIKTSNIETKAVRAEVKGKIFHRIQLNRTLSREDAEVTRTFLAKKLGLKGAWIEEQQR